MIILASQSPTRQALLRAAGVTFQAMKPTFDEDAYIRANPGLPPKEIALALARHKALSISTHREAACVIGADQTLECEGLLFQKPTSIIEARRHLIFLRGKTHMLHTACAVYHGNAEKWTDNTSSHLHMRNFSDTWLDHYLTTCGPQIMGSVGAYQIEGQGLQCFDTITGEHTAILGLNLLPLLNHLRQMGELSS